MISDAERNYRWYRGVFDGDEGPPADVPADLLDDLDDIFAQEALWKSDCGDEGASFRGDDRSPIATAVAQISKLVSASGSKFADLVQDLAEKVEASRAAAVEAKKKVERQKKLVQIE